MEGRWEGPRERLRLWVGEEGQTQEAFKGLHGDVGYEGLGNGEGMSGQLLAWTAGWMAVPFTG